MESTDEVGAAEEVASKVEAEEDDEEEEEEEEGAEDDIACPSEKMMDRLPTSIFATPPTTVVGWEKESKNLLF